MRHDAVGPFVIRPIAFSLLFAWVPTLRAQAPLAPAHDGSVAFVEGKELLDQGKDAQPAFRRAVQAFQGRLEAKGESPEVFLNLGNAAFLADDLPRAIWAFRSGLALDPHHARLRENLAHARAQVPYAAGTRGRPEPGSWPAWLPRLSANAWLIGGLACYASACGALTLWFFRRETRFLTA